MKTIIESAGDPLMIEDRTTPVFETTQHGGKLWLSLHEAASVTGEKIPDIVLSASNKVPTASGLQFGWPSRKMLTSYLPDYRVVRRAPANQPIPVSVTFTVGTGKRAITEVLHYRSISQFCACNELSWARGNKLLARQPGWKRLLPALMTSVQQHPAGWTPPGGWPQHTGAVTGGPLFTLTVARGGVGVKYIGPTHVGRISDLPDTIRNNC